MHGTIVSPATLSAHLHDPDWCVVDCRYSLAESGAGRLAYEQAHIPGAVYAHLDDDLAAPVGPDTGRHPLPDVGDFARTLSRFGISHGTQVVAYDDSGGAFASRLWWMLRWVGHDGVAVLDGGLTRWTAEGRELATAPSSPRGVTRFRPKLRPDMICGAMTLSRELERGGCLLLDARDAPRYLGDEEPLDHRAGHIPGAMNYPYKANLDPDGRFLDPALLRRCFQAALGARGPEEVISMCGSGVTACHNLLAMAIAGLEGGRLYAGSWSHWIQDPARPVVTGPDPS